MTSKNTEAEALRAQANQHEADAAESFERSDTDGFLSQWASGLNAQKARREADILEAGGIATFGVYELQTLDGEPVRAKLIRGKYGPCWALLAEDSDDFTGKFIGAHPDRPATLARKGYQEVVHEFVAPAKAVHRGSNSTNVTTVTVPVESGVKYDLVVGLGDWREVN